LPPQAILVSDRSISKNIFSSETTWPNKPKLFFFFQEKIFLEINQSETRMACGGHVCKWFGTK
jgi:hypothetical protein